MRVILSLILMSTVAICTQSQTLDNFKFHAQYLASDKLEGRGNGSKGIRLAAKYIAAQFKSIGLKPGGGRSYYQKFSIPNQTAMESNVIGVIPAAKPTNRALVFTAHYDAYGIKKVEGKEDAIHNGARDNAIGVAALIELARMFSKEGARAQNLVFVATAAEESGFLGSRYYVENPVFPLKEITICLNIDGFNVYGRKEDFFIMPRQGVDFINEITSVAASMGWFYIPPDWVDSMNTNFDAVPFLAKGVPAFTLWTGNRSKGGKLADRSKFGRIHTPGDEINEYWSWDGVEEHLALYKAIADYFLDNPGGIKVTDPKLFIGKD